MTQTIAGDSTSSADAGRRPWLPAILLVSLFAAAAVPVILSGNMGGRGAYDAVNFHVPVIRAFAQELPSPDLSNYIVTATPGFHLLQATIVRLLGDHTYVMQFTSMAIALGLVGTLALACARWADWRAAAVCTLPLACSFYTFQSGVWALPDNLGWWGVLGILLVALSPRPDARRLALGGLLLLALVLVRQIHVWAAAVLWASAWIGQGVSRDGPAAWTSLTEHVGLRTRRAMLAMLATAPAFLALGWFVWTWRGLTPPVFHRDYTGLGASAPALILALLGVFSAFFAGYLVEPARRLWRDHSGLILVAGGLGALAGLLPATTKDIDAGRNSGLWHAAHVFGIVGGRTSVLIVLLATCGGVALAVWLSALRFRDRWVMMAAFAAFMAAQSASPMVWQRYDEPFLLIACALMACRAPGEPEPAWRRALRWGGPVALAVGLGVVTAWIVLRSEPTAELHYDPHARELPRGSAGG